MRRKPSRRAVVSRGRARVPDTGASPEIARAILERSPALLFAGDVDGNGVFVSRGWLEFTGWTTEQALGTGWWDCIHPDDLERVRGEFERGRTPPSPLRIECRLRRADGPYRWILASSDPRFDADGRFAGYVGVCVDITERKRAEERTAALLEVTRVVNGTVERDELIARVSERTAALLPCDRVVLYHWDADLGAYRAIFHYGVPAALLAASEGLSFPPGTPIVDRALAGDVIVVDRASAAEIGVADLLDQFDLATFAVLPLSVHGRTVGALVVLRDTSGPAFTADELELADGIARQLAVGLETAELMRAQREEAWVSSALARVGQELISSLDTPVMLERLCRVATEELECDCCHAFIWDAEGACFVAVAGYGDPPEQWEALRAITLPRSMMVGDERALWSGDLVEVGRLGSAARQFGMTTGMRVLMRRGDAVIGVLTAAYRRAGQRFSPQQQRIGAGIAQLATMALENARLVEELQQASRLKSDFVASMSHELRTPLNVILGYNTLLLDGEFGPLNATQEETARAMGRSAHELLELINTTLDLGRLENGRLPVNLTEVELSDLIDEIDRETRLVRTKDGVVFRWAVESSLPRLSTDRLKLKVVLKNLIGNAMKFTTRGRVSVTVRHAAEEIEFTVSDTGIGIAPEAHAVIFEPFRQAESDIGQTYGGVGLGLYIARRLVHLLGGTITMESTPGTGSTFQVRVPRLPRGAKESS